jgi:hypothetical protein
VTSTKETYSNLISDYSENLKFVKVKLRRLSIFRLSSFLIAIICPFILSSYYTGLTVFSSFFFIAIFLSLVVKHGKANKEQRLLKNYISLNSNELKALDYDFSPFPTGDEYLDSSHKYTFDLDIFGDYSLFRFLNRTSTRTGDEKLASWLTHPLLSGEEISNRQEAIKELSQKLEWRQKLSAYSLLYKENRDDVETLKNWGTEEIFFSKHRLFRILGVAMPAITLTSLLLTIIDIIPLNIFNITVAIQLLLLYIKRKKVIFFFRTFGKRSAILSKYSELFQIIEDETFQSTLLKKWQESLTLNNATKKTKELKREVNLFDARLNIIAGIILNTLFLWDINRCIKLSDWHNKHHMHLAEWMEAIAKFDAIVSLANYSFNYPDNVFPSPVNDNSKFTFVETGHPLIPLPERINNSFHISEDGNFAIVTGANMAGKSTFLRTVGVNLVLAMSGAPVCAKEFEFTPMPIFTHMRTDDNLSRHESYFFAELKRLKAILEELKGNKKVFVILDEILRGTNSEDKLKGSWKYFEQLIKKKGIGILATHDLKLTEL